MVVLLLFGFSSSGCVGTILVVTAIVKKKQRDRAAQGICPVVKQEPAVAAEKEEEYNDHSGEHEGG